MTHMKQCVGRVKNYMWWSLLTVAVILLGIGLFSAEQIPVQKQISCVEVSTKAPVEVTVSGTYFRYPLRDDHFVGTIMIPGRRECTREYVFENDKKSFFVDEYGQPFGLIQQSDVFTELSVMEDSYSIVCENIGVEAQTAGTSIYLKDPNGDRAIPLPYQTAQSDTLTGYRHILVDVSCLEEELNRSLQTAYQEGANILFVGDISVSEVEEVLGLPVATYPVEAVQELRDTLAAAGSEYKNVELINVSAFHSVGKKVSSDRDRTIIADITVETETPNEIAEAINVALAYDYFALTREKYMQNSPRIDWEPIALIASTQYTTKCVVHNVTELRKYPLNPFGDGKYGFSVWRSCEAEGRSGCHIRSIESEIGGKQISRMVDYQYDATEKSDVINESEQSSIKKTKLSGGIARPHVRVQFLPVSRMGLSAPATSLRAFVEAEFYQIDEVFAAGGFSDITLYDTVFGKNPTTYQTNIDILAGT